jgi:hypothetical protein
MLRSVPTRSLAKTPAPSGSSRARAADGAIAQGSAVAAPHRPEWGIGVVVSIAGPNARVFFLQGGRHTVDMQATPLSVMKPAREQLLVCASIARARPGDWVGKRCHHSVYVVLLDDAVRKNARFAAKNRRMRRGLPCVYVGLTGLTPEERFANHRAGHKGARFAGTKGVQLVPDLYQRFNPMPFAVGAAFEPYLAGALRREGYGVWQN